ncbi:MAG: hypothetical protein V8S33_10165 [Intestinibacter bartlettii]
MVIKKIVPWQRTYKKSRYLLKGGIIATEVKDGKKENANRK